MLEWCVTIVYSALVAGGFFVGVRQIWQGHRRPGTLLNPLFANPVALRMFTVHIVVVSLDLFVVGPIALAHKATLWYWGSRVLLVVSSLPIAAYLNRNPESFGQFIGRWVRFRNFFEYGLHIVFAALPTDWFRYYLLLYWLVAYRYLDVGPRRLLQRLYDTPEKRAARPWAQYLNFGVIFSIYVLAFVAVQQKLILFAKVPGDDVQPHVAASWEQMVVFSVILGLAIWEWLTVRKYTESLGAQTGGTPEPVATSRY